MKATIAKPVVLSVFCAFLASGCMFTVKHELPQDAYFGHLPSRPAERSDRFRDHGMKNWALAGLLPYSRWSSRDLLLRNADAPNERIEDLAIETRFGTLDTIIWVVPGFFYGYYIWAPRTVEVTGSRVLERQGTR